MQKIKKTSVKIENLIVFFIWLVILIVPIIIFYKENTLNWQEIYRTYRILIPFFILFLIHHYFFIPFFLFKKKIFSFILINIFALSIIGFGHYIYEKKFDKKEDHFDRKPITHSNIDSSHLHKPQFHKPDKKPPHPNFYFLIFINAAIGLLIIGFDLGLRMIIKWSDFENEKAFLEKESINNQLAFLKYQISPHFFMNTLNNIHSLIDINTEEAKQVIVTLSKLMRYLLYESNEVTVPIPKEIEFLESFVNLMKLRFSEKVKISFAIEGEIPNKKIPPLLLISFVENAFKHGISYKQISFIHIELKISEKEFEFYIENSIIEKNNKQQHAGIGIENTKKRLNLIFGKNYKLDISSDDAKFKLKLIFIL